VSRHGNYTVKALAGKPALDRLLANIGTRSVDGPLIDRLWNGLNAAQVFLLPEGGLVFHDERFEKYEPAHLRLPYPFVAMEIVGCRVLNNGGPVVVLCIQIPESQFGRMYTALDADQIESAIASFVLMSETGCEWWSPVVEVASVRLKDGAKRLISRICAEASFRALTKGNESHYADLSRGAEKTCAFVQPILDQFLCALECKNVRVEDFPPPPKLQAKRLRSGKLPLVTYKVLTLDAEPKVVGAVGTGTNASPRTHLRRGHIRRLPNGNIWVNATVVKGSNGLVLKDYRVAA
jgi:hypothetical protein